MSSKLVLIRGPICSGKSMVTRVLREKLDQASLADFDSIKQQIDFRASSNWRREIALRTAVFLAGELLNAERTVIAEVHSAFHEQYEAFKNVAEMHQRPFYSFLITAPMDVCLQRNRSRRIPDPWYAPGDAAVREHWEKTEHIAGEPEFDTSRQTVRDIVTSILDYVRSSAE